MIIYNLYKIQSNYILIFINLINIFIYVYLKIIFIDKRLNNYLIVLHIISLLLIICSILDSEYKYIYIIKYSILFINLLCLIYFNYKQKKIVKNDNKDKIMKNLIELYSVV